MYHVTVSTQGVDECIINVRYYYIYRPEGGGYANAGAIASLLAKPWQAVR